ncbi:hypothetical protein MMC08_007300 [Hypocenomyce scalaris]|nr:hypothetical protein [Hypocenomyce scalaris]
MAILGIEQRFIFRLSLLSRFRANQGTPLFRQLKFLGVHSFEDAYFDVYHKLSKKGLWVRKRDHVWHAKQKTDGTSTHSAFEETTDPAEIREMIRKHLPQCGSAEDNFGLRRLCRFKTSRENYLADGKFMVALDKTNFGHAVGEVELMAQDAQSAHKEVEDFIKKYSWFFGTETAKSKLTAYFEKFGMPSNDPLDDLVVDNWLFNFGTGIHLPRQ